MLTKEVSEKRTYLHFNLLVSDFLCSFPTTLLGGHEEWKPGVDKLILEMLSNRTPPSCIPSNIVACAKCFLPNSKVVKELPCVKYIRELRDVMKILTRTLSAMEVGRSLKIKQLHADETTKRGKSVLGVVTTILQENNKLKTICLAGDIIPENGTAEVQTKEIILSFAEGGRFLDDWREQTKMMYANDPDLNEMLNQIPGRERLCVSRLLKVFYTSDTCGAARKGQRLFAQTVINMCREMGITDEKELVIYIVNCQQHIRNILVKALKSWLQKRTSDLIEFDKQNFPSHLRLTTDIMNIHRMVEKECSQNMTDAKGHGLDFHAFIDKRCEGSVRIPFTRVLKGEKQDVAFEACIPTYFHRKDILAWLIHAQVAKDPNNETNVLQTALWTQLMCVEMIAQLRVGGIFFMSILLPMRWLAGNTHLLEHREWGEKHFSIVLDLTYDAFQEIEEDPSKFMDEDFMMNIYKPLYEQLPELEDHLLWYFEEKNNLTFGDTTQADRKPGMKLAREELFHPIHQENRETHDKCLLLCQGLGACMILEMEDPRKVTHEYLDAVKGKYSVSQISEEEKKASYGIKPNNDPVEQSFACLDHSVATMGGNASVSRAAASGVAMYNQYLSRDTTGMVTGRRSKKKRRRIQKSEYFTALMKNCKTH